MRCWTVRLCVHIAVRLGLIKKGTESESKLRQAIGLSKGGLTTKVMVSCDAVGKPLEITLLPGNACELDGADLLIPNIEADIVIADKGFDADARVREPLTTAGKTAVIPSKSNRKNPLPYDKQLYRLRHRIENFFSKLKDYRAIATRYDKLARNYLAAIHLVAGLLWIK